MFRFTALSDWAQKIFFEIFEFGFCARSFGKNFGISVASSVLIKTDAINFDFRIPVQSTDRSTHETGI